MSKNFLRLEKARYGGPDDWRDLESCVDHFCGHKVTLTERSELLVKRVGIVVRLAEQDPPPADLPVKQKKVQQQRTFHEHDLRCVVHRVSELQTEIHHCLDEVALANVEHLAWLLDGTPCEETPFFQNLCVGSAPRGALAVTRQKKRPDVPAAKSQKK